MIFNWCLMLMFVMFDSLLHRIQKSDLSHQRLRKSMLQTDHWLQKTSSGASKYAEMIPWIRVYLGMRVRFYHMVLFLDLPSTVLNTKTWAKLTTLPVSGHVLLMVEHVLLKSVCPSSACRDCLALTCQLVGSDLRGQVLLVTSTSAMASIMRSTERRYFWLNVPLTIGSK